MKVLLRDSRVQRLLVANTLGSIGSGVTIFAVPWLLVHREGGNEAYRWATLLTTVALLLFTPYYGMWLDRHSRKTALLASEAWGAIATVAMAGLGLALGGFATWQLTAIYFAGMFYYSMHYPAKFAFIQQIFDRSQYQTLTGLVEIQGQTAMMIAGGLGGVLVDVLPLWAILLFDAGTYVASLLILATVPYHPSHLAPAGKTTAPRQSAWGAIAEGLDWLRQRPRLALFFTGALIPFVLVMSGNYLFPIYVAQTLHAPATTFAAGEIAFAIGAVLAGYFLPRLIAHKGAALTIPATMLVFLGGLVVIIVLRFPVTFVLALALIGFGNSGCRVARSALLLERVPNAVMGRVSSFFQILDRLLRTALVSAMVVIDTHGPPAGYALLAATLVIALVAVQMTRSALQSPVPAGATA